MIQVILGKINCEGVESYTIGDSNIVISKANKTDRAMFSLNCGENNELIFTVGIDIESLYDLYKMVKDEPNH